MTDPLYLLETERLVLSGWRRDQLPDLVRLHGDPVVAKYLRPDGQPWPVADLEKELDYWIELFETRRLGKLRVTRKSDGVLVGRCGYGLFQGEPELGFALFPEFWGNGYAGEAAVGQRDWIFRATDVGRIIGSADVRNHASRKVLRGIGMRETHVSEDDGMTLQFHVFERGDLAHG